MLVYNGLVSNAIHWRYWVEHFRRSFQVVTWNYRGHGPYDGKHDLGRVSIEGFAEDGHAVLAAVGGGPAVIAGLSMGVQSVLEHVRQNPRDAAALVLSCGTCGHPLDRLGGGECVRRVIAGAARGLARVRPLAKALLAPLWATALMREAAYLTGGAHRAWLPPEILDELFQHVRRMQPGVIATIFASYVEHSAEDVLAQVRVPTLIFAGGADELTPPERAHFMAARIADAEVHVVPGHSHLLQLERPDLVHRVVDDWLGRKGLVQAAPITLASPP
jgi:pimeloyl-ACP methyl ester carboxylesterase